jgi:glyoxylase-like metal-dependent hydrolase (beta-lactamase superfamily II)
MGDWDEVGDGVFVRRYEFFDQNIVAIRGDGEVGVVDTRTTYAQARELQDDLRRLTPDPWVVINTHHHFDHSNGNALFLPADIWGLERCAEVLRERGAAALSNVARSMPELAGDLSNIAITPPNRTFAVDAVVAIGGREVALRHFGRGHTDNDIAVLIPDAGVLLAGDLVEQGAPPSFGDSFPLEWGPTVTAMLMEARGPVVPGHGAVVDRAFVEGQRDEIATAADGARRVHAAGGTLAAAVAAVEAETGYPSAVALTVAERTFAELEPAS